MSYTLGIDVGTFESKASLVDGAGAIVAQAATPHKMIVPRPGWAEHRAEEDWWGDVVTLCRKILADSRIPPQQIAAVAISAIGPCMLPVDSFDRPLMNGVLYGVDTRAEREIEDLDAQIGADLILDRCGNALTSQLVGPKILWLKRNHPDLFERTHKILTSTSFIVLRLTGECVIDHYSAAGFSPLYDVDRLRWTTELTDGIVERDHLPQLHWTTDIVGEITRVAAEATGLAQGTPVTCGTIDAAAEAISVGVAGAGDMMVMYGSTIFIIQITEERLRDGRIWYAPWLFAGQHTAMAGLATSGTLTHWFRDQFARELDPETAFATLAAEAEASPPGARGLLCLPYFSGERTPIHDPRARGTFFGLDLTHTRGDMYRALIEGIAMGTAHVTETFTELGAAPQRILAVGGGTKNALWMQATSDYSGLPQIVSEKSLGASYGNAFLAALALGRVTRDDISGWNPAVAEVAPCQHEVYARHYPLFKEFYTATREIAYAL